MTSTPVTPSQEELKKSAILQEKIREEMRTNAGSISFQDYMQMCLYTPELGYYTGPQEIFSQAGDFVTSAEYGKHFAYTLASHIYYLDLFDKQTTVIEIGAGNGAFAHSLIEALISLGNVPLQYFIVEISATLKKRQRDTLQEFLERDDIEITWLDKAESCIDSGIVIANEVVDALPVNLISIRDAQLYERWVTIGDDQEFCYCNQPISPTLASRVQERLPDNVFSEVEYHTEVNTGLNQFMQETAAMIAKGVLFFVDYGYPRKEYYLPERNMGTLLCHYKHTANDQPLRWPGLQDISCNVDFTALAEAGMQADLQLNCYCTQAQFLLASEYFQSLQVDASSTDAVINSSQLKNLVMPDAMGERFQVMVFTKDLQLSTTEFTLRDLTYRL